MDKDIPREGLHFMKLENKILFRKRGVIESVNDQLKNICQIEHSRYIAQYTLLLNIFCGIIAYQLKDRKPTVRNHFDNVKVA